MLRLEPVQRTRTADTIIEQILSGIRSAKLKPGDKLPSEAELMKQTGLGRPSVRSALRSLEALNIIEIRQGVGAFIREVDVPFMLADMTKVSKLFSRRSIIEAVIVRQMLEPEIAAVAAKEATRKDLKQIHSALQAFKNLKAGSRSLKNEHTAFHLCIAESTHNLLLTRVQNFLLSLWEEGFERVFPRGSGNRSHIEKMYSDHKLLYDAIAAGDPEPARLRMLEHIEMTKNRLARMDDPPFLNISQREK